MSTSGQPKLGQPPKLGELEYYQPGKLYQNQKRILVYMRERQFWLEPKETFLFVQFRLVTEMIFYHLQSETLVQITIYELKEGEVEDLSEV